MLQQAVSGCKHEICSFREEGAKMRLLLWGEFFPKLARPGGPGRERIHLDRVARGNCHYRHFGGLVVAGTEPGEAEGD